MVHARNRNPGEPRDSEVFLKKLTSLAQHALNTISPDVSTSGTKPKAFLNRLLLNPDKLVVFLTNPLIQPTNNLSEQALRPFKVKMKRSGRMRGTLEHYLKVQSYVQTGVKQNQNILNILTLLFENKPWIPQV